MNVNILVKLQFGQSRVDVQSVEHIGLFIIVRSEYDVVDDMFKSLLGF